MHKRPWLTTFALTLLAGEIALSASDWNEWRGPNRNGTTADSPALISTLPPVGLTPVWKSESIKSGGEGGWGSPIVANGSVYLFAHTREQIRELDPPKFPPLTEEQQKERTPEELAEYEKNRLAEEKERRALQFRYREQLYCFDASTGETRWTNRSDSLYTQFPQSGSPTVVDDRLYILGAGRRLRCIDAESGDDLWNTPLPGEFEDQYFQSSVLVIDGILFLTADRQFGVNADSGVIRWESSPELTGVNNSSPALWTSASGKRAVCNLDGGWTACVDPQSGAEIWRVQSEAAIATPVIAGDRLLTYGSTRKAGLRCYQMTDTEATELWVYHGLCDNGGSPVVHDHHVYLQGGDRVACVDLDTGKAEWTANLDLHSPQYTSLIAADGKIFYAYESLICWDADPRQFRLLYDGRFAKSGQLALYEQFRNQVAEATTADGTVTEEVLEAALNEHLGNPALGCASPAIADGRIYLRLQDGLACYDLRAASVQVSHAP